MFLIFISIVFCLLFININAEDNYWQIEFNKISGNPILGPLNDTWWRCPIRKRPIRWEDKDVFNPGAVVKDNKVYLLYRAEDKLGRYAGTSRIGIAWSEDGIQFSNRLAEPVLYPDRDSFSKYEWDGGCEDPRIVESPNGEYVMTYTSYDGTARLSVATSTDLMSWKKHGPAFGNAHQQSFRNAWTKSGSIVVQPTADGRLVAVKINGSYWMYWGENEMHVATSPDLISWTPMLDPNAGENEYYRGRPDHKDANTYAKKPLSIFGPRRGMFDSNLVEPGPPAILREDGILFMYNSKNTACDDQPGQKCVNGEADPDLPPGTYSAGQVLMSRTDPTVVLKRSSKPFFKPTMEFEKTGQVGNVCFVEGLVYFNHKWFLYYGTADSKIAVAEAVNYDGYGKSLAKGLKSMKSFPPDGNEEILLSGSFIKEERPYARTQRPSAVVPPKTQQKTENVVTNPEAYYESADKVAQSDEDSPPDNENDIIDHEAVVVESVEVVESRYVNDKPSVEKESILESHDESSTLPNMNIEALDELVDQQDL